MSEEVDITGRGWISGNSCLQLARLSGEQTFRQVAKTDLGKKVGHVAGGAGGAVHGQRLHKLRQIGQALRQAVDGLQAAQCSPVQRLASGAVGQGLFDMGG